MNALRLLVSFFICAGTLLASALAILTFSPNWLYPAHDPVLSAAVLSDRPFIATVLSDRSPIEDTPSHLGVRVPDVAS